MRAVQLSCRRYGPRRVSRALPRRGAWRSLGSLMVVGVRGLCPGSGGIWWREPPKSGASTLMYVRLSPGLAGLRGAGCSRGRGAGGSRMSQVLMVRGPGDDRFSGARWWCLAGLWTGIGGVCGLLNRLVHIWVMYGMVIDELHHVFPGNGVGELPRVCQQEAFAMCHLGRCPADRFQLEVCHCLLRFFCLLG